MEKIASVQSLFLVKRFMEKKKLFNLEKKSQSSEDHLVKKKIDITGLFKNYSSQVNVCAYSENIEISPPTRRHTIFRLQCRS